MAAVLEWAGDDDLPQAPQKCRLKQVLAPGELPAEVAGALWRGDHLGSPVEKTISSGFAELDNELPGGGWPCQALTELLQAQATVAEWRLLAPAMRSVVTDSRDIVIVGPPKNPHLPGLRDEGIDERRLVWIQATTPAERLWVTEQLVKANAAGMVIAWLPQARQEQIRRLQVCAQACDSPVFLCRPQAAAHEPSAAPLRLQVSLCVDWALHIRLLKRKGPAHEGTIKLPSMPAGLRPLMTPRISHPSVLFAQRHQRAVFEGTPDVLGRASSGQPALRLAAH